MAAQKTQGAHADMTHSPVVPRAHSASKQIAPSAAFARRAGFARASTKLPSASTCPSMAGRWPRGVKTLQPGSDW